ncbi:MAG: hypothetical protein ABW168_13625 [Sedimenticola sp.]
MHASGENNLQICHGIVLELHRNDAILIKFQVNNFHSFQRAIKGNDITVLSSADIFELFLAIIFPSMQRVNPHQKHILSAHYNRLLQKMHKKTFLPSMQSVKGFGTSFSDKFLEFAEMNTT